MRRRFLLAVLSSAVLLPVLGTGVRAAPPARVRLETLVPATSLAFAGLEDVGSWGERWKATAMGRLTAEPEVQAFAAPVVEDVKKLLEGSGSGGGGGPGGGPGGKGGSPVPDEAREVLEVLKQLQGLSGQAAVALVNWPREGTPAVAASLDFGDHLSDFLAFLARFQESMKKRGGPPITTSTRGTRPWWTVGTPERPVVHATAIGTALLVSTDGPWLEGVADSDGAARKDALSEHAPFRRVRERAGGDGTALFAWVNVPEVIERVPMPADARRIANALGLDAVHGAGYGCAFKGDGFLDTIVIDAPKADHGILTALKTRPISHAALSLAPSTALYYTESGLVLDGILPRVKELATVIEPDAAPEIDRFLAQANEVLGVDLEKDLVAGLASEHAAWLGLPPTGGLFPEAAVCLAVEDPKAYEAVVAKAVDGVARRVARDGRIAVATRTLDYRGTTLHLVDLHDARGSKVIPFQPTWAILGDRLVVTLVPHTMKEIVLRRAAKDAGLAGEEDVRALLRAGPEGHGGFEYLDLQAVLSFLYDTAVPVLQTAVKPNVLPIPVRLDWAQLPAARTVRPHLRSMAAFGTSDDEGLRVSIHAPIPVVPLAVAVGAAAAVAFSARSSAVGRAGRAAGSASDEANRMVAEAQIQSLAAAVEMYRIDQNKLPERLERLLDKNPKTGEAYLEALPLDPWRQPFDYATPGAQHYRISSAGPDRTWGTEDDIVYPASPEPK